MPQKLKNGHLGSDQRSVFLKQWPKASAEGKLQEYYKHGNTSKSCPSPQHFAVPRFSKPDIIFIYSMSLTEPLIES